MVGLCYQLPLAPDRARRVQRQRLEPRLFNTRKPGKTLGFAGRVNRFPRLLPISDHRRTQGKSYDLSQLLLLSILAVRLAKRLGTAGRFTWAENATIARNGITPHDSLNHFENRRVTQRFAEASGLAAQLYTLGAFHLQKND